MPALSLGIVSSALLIRIMRTVDDRGAVVAIISAPPMPKERRKRIVMRRHALRNAMIPYVNVAAVEFGFLFGSVVVIEDIFLSARRRLAGARRHHQPRLPGPAGQRADHHARSCSSSTLIVDIGVGLLDPRAGEPRHR